MIYLRSGFFYLGYLTSGFLFGFLGCMICPFLSLKLRIKFLSIWPRFSNWLLYKSCDIKVIVLGAEGIPDPPFVVVSNHQGQWETFYFQYLFFPLTTLLKKELLFIPFWGWSLALLRPISIDRKNPKTALKKVLSEGEDRINGGFSVLFFPEGTRSKPKEVGKYARSGFELAKKCKVPVLPIVHNSGTCWPAHKFLKYPGNITLKIGSPFKDTSSTKVAAKGVEEWTKKEILEMQS